MRRPPPIRLAFSTSCLSRRAAYRGSAGPALAGSRLGGASGAGPRTAILGCGAPAVSARAAEDAHQHSLNRAAGGASLAVTDAVAGTTAGAPAGGRAVAGAGAGFDLY